MSSHDDRARRAADSLIVNSARRDFRLSNIAASADDLEAKLKADPLFKQLEKYYATAPEDQSGNIPLGYYNKNMKPLMDALVKKYKTNQGVIGELAGRGAGMSNVSAAAKVSKYEAAAAKAVKLDAESQKKGPGQELDFQDAAKAHKYAAKLAPDASTKAMHLKKAEDARKGAIAIIDERRKQDGLPPLSKSVFMSNSVSAAGTTDTKYNSYDKKITAALSAAKASTTAARISLIALRKSDAEIPGEVNLEQCEKYIVAAMSNLMNAVRELGGGVGV